MIPEPTAEQLEWFERDSESWANYLDGLPPTHMIISATVRVAAHYRRLWEAALAICRAEAERHQANDDPQRMDAAQWIERKIVALKEEA